MIRRISIFAVIIILLTIFSNTAILKAAPSTSQIKEIPLFRDTVGKPLDIDKLAKQDSVVALKLLVVLYPRTFTWEMDDASIANFHREVAQWISWYDEIAGEKLKLEIDFLQINRCLSPKASGPQGGNVYWMGPGDCENDLLKRGIEPGIYDSVAVFWAWDRDKGAQQAYGGGAIGPDDTFSFLGREGRTSYFGSAVLKSHPDNVSKVAIHEYLHNMDSIFQTAGMPDKFFSSDDMAINMRKLVQERPGVFKEFGYSDKDMVIMADKERRREAAFPWRTQLVYYRWMLERTPKEDFIELLRRFGSYDEKSPRNYLYNSWKLPEGIKPFQVCINENTNLEKIDSLDAEKSDNFIHWQKPLWSGIIENPDKYMDISYYKEAEIVVPDSLEYVIGQGDFTIQGKVLDTVSHKAIGNAEVDIESDSGFKADFQAGKLFGHFQIPLDRNFAKPSVVTLNANAESYIISTVKSDLSVRTCWNLSCDMGDLSSGEKGLTLKLDGPDGDYNVNLDITSSMNYIQTRLKDESLLKIASFKQNVNMKANSSVELPLKPDEYEILESQPVKAIVEWISPAGEKYSFTHYFPPKRPFGDMIKRIDPLALPPYVPRAKKITPVIDGELTEWTGEPSLVVDSSNGNVFQGSVDSPDDASVTLWIGYDTNNMYVAGKVRDDQLTNASLWECDRINLVFDMLLDTSKPADGDSPSGHTSWAIDDYWVFLCPNLPEGPQMMRIGGKQINSDDNGYYGPVANAKVAIKLEGCGYRFEWRIPRKSLPFFNPDKEKLVGFTFFYSDWDKELNELMYLTNWGAESGGIDWRFWDCGLLRFE